MISYSTNWMRPVSLIWYEERGIPHKNAAPQQRWCGGRIDVRGTDNPYGDEIGLPIMHEEDWGIFSRWLHSFKTSKMWPLHELVAVYEKTHTPIRWAKECLQVS